MTDHKLRKWALFSMGLPMIAMFACSGPSSGGDHLTKNLWKMERMTDKKGEKSKKPPQAFYFNLEKGGNFLYSRDPKDTMYWKKDGKELLIHHDAARERKRDKWTIKTLSADTLKVLSEDEGKIMIMSASDKSYGDVVGK